LSERFGDYELLQKIATGGMAEIYLARHVATQGFARPVVVKRMLPQLAVRKDFVTMFLDEARLAANLSHPNVVQVFNLGEHAGSYFMAMELVDGPHLGSLFAHSLRQRRPLPVDLCVYICARSADGLDHAHDLKDPATGLPLQIVHRDISPQNILVSRHGDVKVTDFGVAKATTQEAKTRTGIIKGKVSYMSPEQCLGEKVDRRTDVFALGIVLYELLTRRRLFRDKSDLLVMQRITQEQVPPPSTLNPAIDKELDQITMRALERGREKRYATAADLSEALDVWLALQGIADAKARLGKWMAEHAPDLGVAEGALEAPPVPEAPFPLVAEPAPTLSMTSPAPVTGVHDEGRATPSSLPHARSSAVRPLDAPETTVPNPPAGASSGATLIAEGGTLVTPPPFAALKPEEPSQSTDEASDPSQPPLHVVERVAARGPTLEPTIPDATVTHARPSEHKRPPIAAIAAAVVGVVLVVALALWRSGSDDATPIGAVAVDPSDDPRDPDDDPAAAKDAGRMVDDRHAQKPPVDLPKQTDPARVDAGQKSARATTRLIVTTTPTKVPVFLDEDRYLGQSPIEVDIEPQKLARLFAHFPSGTESVEAVLTDARVEVALVAHIPLTLRSAPSPASAVITGPGMERGVKVTTPVSGNVKLRAGGTYEIIVSAAGHEPSTIEVTAEGKLVERTATLKKDKDARSSSKPSPKPTPKPVVVERAPPQPVDPGEGVITIFSEPWTSATVAGRSFSATPVTREKVKAGTHVVRVVRREFGINETLRVNVPKDGSAKVIFVFEDAGDGKYKIKSKRVE